MGIMGIELVVQDEKDLTCRIYGIKHSREIAPEQNRHLTDGQNCKRAAT